MDRLAQKLKDYEVEEIWAYKEYGQELPRQGYKIHISAHLENCLEIFDLVSQYLNAYKIPHKLTKSIKDLEKLNTGLYGNSQVGKFITIYSLENTERIIVELEKILSKFKAPIIISDKRYLDSILYYRYGVIKSLDGKVDFLLTPEKDYELDDRSGREPIPKWAPVLNLKNINSIAKTKLKKIIVTKTLRQRGRGGVFEGSYRDLNSGKVEKVILKECRYFGEYYSKEDCSESRFENELKVLNKLKKSNAFPYVYEVITGENNKVMVMKKIDGVSLKNIMLEVETFPQEFLEKFKDEMLIAINQLHNKKIVHGDISPDNIIINDGISIIDFEHAIDLEDKGLILNYGSKGFYKEDACDSSDESLKKRDFYGLERCLYYLENLSEYKELVHA